MQTSQRYFSQPILITLLAVLLFSSCSRREFERRIEGHWERIQVENINPTHTEVWIMRGNTTTINRHSVANPSEVITIDQGFYVVERKGIKMYVRLSAFRNSTLNNSWEIINLTDNLLVILIEVPGGIFLKEFVRKAGL